ncbi:MAG: hypothetical protein DSZ06_01650 [Sulfurospirillum sp.]|nr:MAG: hypothetical protein DSZ06_01650 [Sulfurospirillum sp.]
MYMTVLHYIAIAFFVLVFLLLSLLAWKEENIKTRRLMIVGAFLVSVVGGLVSVATLEKHTKKVKITSYTQRRNLLNETIQFEGYIKNVGKFKVNECKMVVKMVNKIKARGRGKNAFFKPSASLNWISGKDGDKSNVIEEEFTVARNLGAKRSKEFRINMKYPPYMNNPNIKLNLECH